MLVCIKANSVTQVHVGVAILYRCPNGAIYDSCPCYSQIPNLNEITNYTYKYKYMYKYLYLYIGHSPMLSSLGMYLKTNSQPNETHTG